MALQAASRVRSSDKSLGYEWNGMTSLLDSAFYSNATTGTFRGRKTDNNARDDAVLLWCGFGD